MVAKVIFAFLMSFATASLVTIAHIFYKDISYELIFDTYIHICYENILACGVYLHYLDSTYIAKIYTQTNFIIRQFLYGGAGEHLTLVYNVP